MGYLYLIFLTILLWCLILPALKKPRMILSWVNKLFIICGTQVRCSFAAQHWNFISRGEMFNSLYRFFEKRFQKCSSYNLIDEDKIFKLSLHSGHLMFEFNGVYAADNFPWTCLPIHLLLLTHHQPLQLDLIGLCLQRDLRTQ